MDDYSHIVIADMVLSDVGCLRDLAMQDLNMMSLGGMERSESEWKELIASAGLVLTRLFCSLLLMASILHISSSFHALLRVHN